MLWTGERQGQQSPVQVAVAPGGICGIAAGWEHNSFVIHEEGILAALRLHFERMRILSRRAITALGARLWRAGRGFVFDDLTLASAVDKKAIAVGAAAILAEVEHDPVESC